MGIFSPIQCIRLLDPLQGYLWWMLGQRIYLDSAVPVEASQLFSGCVRTGVVHPFQELRRDSG